MMEDLVRHTMRICDGLAREATKRIAADYPSYDAAAIESHIRQVLYDWFLGAFIPRPPRR